MKKIGSTSSGSVIVEMSEAQFEALSLIQATAKPNVVAPASSEPTNGLSLKEKIEYVRPRLAKLRPKKKDGAVKSIEAMFQFSGGIGSGEIQKILSALVKEGALTITPTEQLVFNT